MARDHFLRWIEGQAAMLRRLEKLSTRDVLDPYALASRMRVQVIEPADVAGLAPDTLRRLIAGDPSSWSAGTISLPGGEAVVVMNPTHAATRRRATLMEELAHIHLKHRPTEFLSIDGKIFRTFKKSQETQAYWVGAAALLPAAVLEHARQNDVTGDQLARTYGVSSALTRFRQQVTGYKLAA